MIDEDARKQIQKQLSEAVVKQAVDGSQVMEILNADGSATEIENPLPVPATPEPVIAPQEPAGNKTPVSLLPNRHDRRRLAALARRKRGQ